MTQQEAIKTVDRIFNYCEEIDCHLPEDEQTGYEMYPDIIAVMEYIRNIPDIVRCNDCRHCKYIEDSDTYYCDRIYPRRITEPDGFCNHGEVEE